MLGRFRLNSLKKFDIYPKTMEEFSVKTFSGAAVTIISGLIIFSLILSEFIYFMSTERVDHLRVDTTRGERIDIFFNISFPRLSCDVLTLDAVDITGEQQVAVEHDVFKTRIDENLVPVEEKLKTELGESSESMELAKSSSVQRPSDYCGSCYGSEESEYECCNTCDSVREAYRRRGWAFQPTEQIEQCYKEAVEAKLRGTGEEGCNFHGKISVNRVAGNFHISPGKSLYFFNFGEIDSPLASVNASHVIHSLAFGEPIPGITNPLDSTRREISEGMGIFQYFIKVVPTEYISSSRKYFTNQYSVTEHYRPVSPAQTQNGILPGVFFIYDLSPISVHITESRRSFLHFLTGVCAIVGGVITIAGAVDRLLYYSIRKFSVKLDLGKTT